jgi:hypothetical protein
MITLYVVDLSSFSPASQAQLCHVTKKLKGWRSGSKPIPR